VGAVILEHVGGVVGLDEGVVDSGDEDIVVLDGVTEDNPANATEAVDTDLDDQCELEDVSYRGIEGKSSAAGS
jgi:hypothetical protein